MQFAGIFPTLFDHVARGADGNLDQNDLSVVFTIAGNVVRILMYIGGIAAVVIIIVAGIQYITSAGNPDAVTRAKRTITNAVIGLVLVGLAYSIVTFLVGKLS